MATSVTSIIILGDFLMFSRNIYTASYLSTDQPLSAHRLNEAGTTDLNVHFKTTL